MSITLTREVTPQNENTHTHHGTGRWTKMASSKRPEFPCNLLKDKEVK